MSKNQMKWLVLTGTVVVLGFIGLFYSNQEVSSAEQRYLLDRVERGDLLRTVDSTGSLEAVFTVQVGSQVSGRIQELHADFNSVVKKGQLLAVIDPSNYEARRDKARASLTTSRANVQIASSAIESRQAELQSANASLEVDRIDHQQNARSLKRYKSLLEGGLVTDQDFEVVQCAYEASEVRIQQAEAQISQAHATISSAEAQYSQALASVEQAEADLKIAEIDLAYSQIRSPIDGVVIQRSVDIGQTVAATLQAPTLFLIANDLEEMQVTAQVDEADIGSISERAGVEFTVDAFPDEVFQGRISEIRLGSESSDSGATSNVIVYNVIIDVKNPDLKLRPGMTTTVGFTVASSEDALKIPNSALRFTPSGSRETQYPEVDDGTSIHLANRTGGTGTVTVSNSANQYGISPGPKIHFLEIPEPDSEWDTVWILDDDQIPQQRAVLLGISDGIETEVLDGDLQEGDGVIVREFEPSSDTESVRSPFGPQDPPGGRS